VQPQTVRATKSTLSEDVLHLLDQCAALRLVLDMRQPVKLLQQFALALVELARRLHPNLDEQVALPAAVEHRYALVLQPEGRARLRAFGNFQSLLSLQGGHSNLSAESRLRKGNRDHAVQVVAFAREECMLLHVQDHVKIARRPSKSSRFAVSRKPYPCSILHARRTLCLYRPLPQHSALALALGAGIGDYAAHPLAGWTGTRHGEKSLLITHLPSALAGAAGDRRLSRRGPGTRAILASLMTADRHLGLCAEHGLFELKCKIFP